MTKQIMITRLVDSIYVTDIVVSAIETKDNERKERILANISVGDDVNVNINEPTNEVELDARELIKAGMIIESVSQFWKMMIAMIDLSPNGEVIVSFQSDRITYI